MPIESAWIVSWESANDDDHLDEIAIIPGDISIDAVKGFVKFTYMARHASTQERFDLASGRQMPAFDVRVDRQNMTLDCGHNPCVTAVLRRNISLGDDDSLVW